MRKGARRLTPLFGRKRKLRTGATVTVRITAAGAVGSSTALTVRKRQHDPKIVRTRVNP